MHRLEGKIVVITGAASGIGAAAAERFIAEGAKVVLADIAAAALQQQAATLGDAASYQVTDVTSEDAVKALAEQTMATHGRVDAVLLNAGAEGDVHPLPDYPTATFDKVMAVNVRGVWLGLKYFMKAMEQTGGSIVITSSTNGIRATPNIAAYTAAKHAAIGLMRAGAVEGARNRIRINAVCPSPTDTPMVHTLAAKRGYEGRTDEPLARSVPLGRYGRPEEIANLMLFLASDEASFCTGGVYMADGGVSAGMAN